MKKKEWKQYTSVRHLDDLEILKALFFNHSFGRHFHEGYALGLILLGSETYQCNKKTNVAPRGSIVVVNPGEVHDGHASDRDKGWGYFMLYPHLSLVEKALDQLGLDNCLLPFFPDTVIHDPEFAGMLNQFMQGFESGDSKLGLESCFLELLHFLISRHADFTPPAQREKTESKKIQAVVDEIHGRYTDPLSLDNLARNVGLNAWALLRLFKKEKGISPYLLQASLRIKAAKTHLKSGMSLAETAALCGFSDQSHMTKQFRRWMGITPGDYLRDDNFPGFSI